MFSLTSDDNRLYRLSGSLTLEDIPDARRQFQAVFAKAGQGARLDAAGLQSLDTAGALLLRRLIEAGNDGLDLANLSDNHRALMDIVRHADIGAPTPPLAKISVRRLIENAGKSAIRLKNQFIVSLSFLGQTLSVTALYVRHPARLRISALSRHVEETGINAIPIVGLVAFLISIVLAYQGRFQLRPFGAERFTINLVGISVLREMGVLLTAIMVAGRSGSAFTAELGMMKVNEEIDALEVMGIDPFESLVLPRLAALFITMPLLTFIADMLGLLGGALVSIFQLDIPWDQYFVQVRNAAHGHDFFVGMVKAPVFALIIALIGCQYGMAVTGSAESVGRQTTASVVHSTFIILMADALFSILFSQLGI